MRKYTPDNIEKLESNEVFVFGTNADGFHGAGAAGIAFRGTASNTWRSDPLFLRAMQSRLGDEARLGKWAVYGVSKGLMTGKEGLSYGIQTVTRPGARRSVSKEKIQEQIRDLYLFAQSNNHLTFLIAKLGCGYGGYSEEEMKELFQSAHLEVGIPDNIHLPIAFEFRDG